MAVFFSKNSSKINSRRRYTMKETFGWAGIFRKTFKVVFKTGFKLFANVFICTQLWLF